MSQDAVFKERYKKLNKAQKEAVDTIEGPVMVIAGPGTGKTTLLTLRIANILRETDTPPSGILALTFTDAGVKVMKEKLREIIGTRADEIRVHTFHGFAGSVMSEFPEHFIENSRSKQITDVEAESLLREILKNKKYSKLRPLGDPDFYVHKILGAIGDCKKEAWTPEVVRDFSLAEIDRVKNDPECISKSGASKGELKADAKKRIERCEKTLIFTEVFQEYETKKKEERKMDFDDLLFGLVEALQKDKLLLQLLQEKFLYILVDEHQDTNDSQNLIVSLLSNFFESPNIFVVGDEKQAIYRFQGASVENFLKFQKIWQNMKVISLEHNYRSHQGILDATFSMIEENYGENEHQNLRIKLKSGSKENNKPIDLLFAPDTDSADAFLVSELKKISKKEPEATVAVILRWNKDVDRILSLCEANSVEASAERGADIFSHPLGALYFKLLEYLVDPSKIESLAETIALGLWGLNFETSNKLIKDIRSGNIKDISEKIPALATLRKEMRVSGVIDFLVLVGELSGLTALPELSYPLGVEVWRGIVDLARDLAVSSGIENPHALMQELLNYKKTAERKTIKIGSGKHESKIQIMTAHSSKGLEYDYVFLPYATEEHWMRRPRSSSFVLPMEKDNSDEVKDARRLFYVALTRARKHIEVIVPTSDNLGKDFVPLRFILELNKDDVAKQEVAQINSMPKVLHGIAMTSKRKDELLEYAKRIISENGLSVTALNHFLTCPSEFLYKSILKVPEAPNPSSEKGIAMHKALSDVWKSGEKSTSKIASIIKDSVTAFFESSLLPLGDKEMILEELLESIPVIAEALAPHFSIDGKVFTDKWVDTSFVAKYKNKEVRVGLHGQIDALIDTPKKVLVFDYKTREAMSVNAIKGLTESSDGNYFRQLVFYKILLSGDSSFNKKEIEPALVFVKPDDKGRCQTVSLTISDEDVRHTEVEIQELVESVFSGKFLTDICNDDACKWCAVKKNFVT